MQGTSKTSTNNCKKHHCSIVNIMRQELSKIHEYRISWKDHLIINIMMVWNSCINCARKILLKPTPGSVSSGSLLTSSSKTRTAISNCEATTVRTSQRSIYWWYMLCQVLFIWFFLFKTVIKAPLNQIHLNSWLSEEVSVYVNMIKPSVCKIQRCCIQFLLLKYLIQ